MRILELIDRLHLGGSEQVALHLSRSLSGRGHRLWAAALRPGDADPAVRASIENAFREKGTELFELGISGNRLINAAAVPVRLAALIRRLQPDLVHSHTDIPDFMLAGALRLPGFGGKPPKIVRTIHNTQLWPTRSLPAAFTERAFRDDLVIAVSEDAAAAYRELRRRTGRQPSRYIHVVPNGVELPPDPQSREAAVQKFGGDPSRIRILFAGRFVAQKGLDVLLAAIARMPESEWGRLEFHFAGSGELEESLKAQATAGRLPVHFHPPVPRISRWFTGFDYTVLPSRFEGMPLAALESLILGVPVIATNAPGLREVLPPGWPLSGEADDPGSLSQLLMRVARGEFDRSRLSAQAAGWAAPRYRLESMVDRYEKLMTEFAAG